MKSKLLSRLLCVVLSVLMLSCMLPALSVFAAGGKSTTNLPSTNVKDYTSVVYESVEKRLEAMTKVFDNGSYSLYCDEILGIVAYRKNATGETLFTNPWDMSKETSQLETILTAEMSQIILSYIDGKNNVKTLNTFTDAAMKGQMTTKLIKNGIRVEYAIGETSARILLPMRIERSSFEKYILMPLKEARDNGDITSRDYAWFNAYYSLKQYASETNEAKRAAIAKAYPVAEKKNIDLYVYNSTPTVKEMRKLEALVLAYCPAYSFEQMDIDYDLVNYEEEATSPPVFRMALEYTIDENGLQVTLPANGLRYDETAYRITDFQLLPYMGASYTGNDGYTFLPDGSGTLYSFKTPTSVSSRIYGEDYSLITKVSGLHTEAFRLPVFGQAEFEISGGKTVKRGYLGIIESGDTLATIAANHSSRKYASVVTSFITRQIDSPKSSNWSIYACRRYTDDYRLRYILLSDDDKAMSAGLSSYYECSWMGMAAAYRDYLDHTSETFNRLTDADVKENIPLYIESFGCMETIKKVLSVPLTVSSPLTTFEDIKTMYEYLAGEGIDTVNFRLKGFANGGLYSDVPYKLKWESAVGGKSDFKDLLEYAKDKNLGLYPDFDFVFSTGSEMGNAVKSKKNLARTIENRYTSKRSYSATYQTLVSYYQMVLSPATYARFYEKLEKRYSKYGNNGISLSTFGSNLNSDFDENKTVLREEAKEYVVTALSYFKDKGYDIMVDAGNAYAVLYADHVLGVPLDSSRYTTELSAVPFIGAVFHGYVQFTGTALNMEGDLTYAMLKAIENGASAYFVLSFRNTESLKEDQLLSQNYSVRYDIWQQKLVSIYRQLNEALRDVQTKLIIDHRFLSGSRVPDKDELRQDILDEAEREAAELEQRLSDVTLIAASIKQIRAQMSNCLYDVETALDTMENLRYANGDNAMLTAWRAARAEMAAGNGLSMATLSTLVGRFTTDFAEPIAKMNRANNVNTGTMVQEAKAYYDRLETLNAPESIIAEARANLVEVLNLYLAVQSKYNGVSYSITEENKNAYVDGEEVDFNTFQGMLTVSGTSLAVAEEDLEAYIFENDATVNTTYAGIGSNAAAQAFISLLKKDGIAAPDENGKTIFDLQALIQTLTARLADGQKQTQTTTEEEKSFSKYNPDSSIVLVTYGEAGAPYKSFILNFNNYAVKTEVNGVVYTLDAYDYVAIYH